MLFRSIADFGGTGAVADNKLISRITPYLLAELKRMKRLRNMNADPSLTNQDFEYIKRGSEFNAFADVLTSQTKDVLITRLKSETVDESFMTDAVKRDILNYFAKQTQEVLEKFNEAPFIAENIENSFIIKGVSRSSVKETAVKFYTYNSWLNNIESLSVLYGDIAMYKHHKEEFHKRNAGIGSTGTIYRTDKAMQNFINNNLWYGSYAQVNAERLGLGSDEPYKYTGQMKTAVLEDMNVMSAYAKDFQKLIGDKANAYGIEKDGKIKGQNEADAQGLISFDAYRQLKVAEGTWSTEHENLFKQIVQGKPVNSEDITKFFPVIKGQYWGPLQTEGLNVTAFHKYSLFPMIPSVIKNKNMELLHDRMTKEGIAYVTFQSVLKLELLQKIVITLVINCIKKIVH